MAIEEVRLTDPCTLSDPPPFAPPYRHLAFGPSSSLIMIVVRIRRLRFGIDKSGWL